MKKKRTRSLVYVLVLSLAVIFVGGYFIYQANNAYTLDNNSVKKEHVYYSLSSNATVYQEELYDALISKMEATPREDKEIVGLLVQSYIADYYTWTNKTRYNDVTASQFIGEDVRVPFYNLTIDTFYNDLGYYIDEGKQKETLEVTDTTVTSTPIQYNMNTGEEIKTEEGYENITKPIEAFLVEATWVYKDSNVVDVTTYQNKGYFVVVKDEDGLYSIVEAGQEWQEM